MSAAESRTRRRIRKAVETRGYSVLSMEYEAAYSAGEKMGMGGGWTVLTDAPLLPNTNSGDDFIGLNVEEVLADIDWDGGRKRPCDCYPEDCDRHPLVPIKGDPEHPLHEPDCVHHIAYRLPWWSRPERAS